MALLVPTYTEIHHYRATWTDLTLSTTTTQTLSTVYVATPGVFTATYTVPDPYDGASSQLISGIITITSPVATSSGRNTVSAPTSPSTTPTAPLTTNTKGSTLVPTTTPSQATQSPASTGSPTTVLSSTYSITTKTPHPTSQAPTPKPAGVSSGAAAGIGVGCAVAGAILAAIILSFLMRRRRKFPQTYDSPSQETTPSSDPKHPDIMMASLSKSNTMSVVEISLPPPMQDQDIKGNMSKLGQAIKNHAQSYYGGDVLSQAYTADNESAMSSLLGNNAPLGPKDLAAVLSSPKYRTTAVRFLIGWSILQRIEVSGSPETSLLPPELAECLEGMKSFQGNGEVRPTIVSKWRQITAHLLQSSYGIDSNSSRDARQANIKELVGTLDRVVTPFASGKHNSERLQNLEELVKRGARFGYTIFSQPTGWTFDWNGSRSRDSKVIVVYPALVQIEDDRGLHREKEEYYTDAQTIALGSM